MHSSCTVHVQVVSIKWVRQLLQVLFNKIQLVHVQFMHSSCTVHVQVVSIKWVRQLLQVLYNIIQLDHVQFMYVSCTVTDRKYPSSPSSGFQIAFIGTEPYNIVISYVQFRAGSIQVGWIARICTVQYNICQIMYKNKIIKKLCFEYNTTTINMVTQQLTFYVYLSI